MSAQSAPTEQVRPLLRTRQVREFTDEPVSRAELDALADVARWSGSSMNRQPWRFIVIGERDALRRLGEVGHPQTRGLLTAAAAIAIVLPEDGHAIPLAYDEGRAAERMLVGATMLGLAAGISWIQPDRTDAVGAALGVEPGWFIRTIIAVGHPTEAAMRPKSQPGAARLPREEVVFSERWPKS